MARSPGPRSPSRPTRRRPDGSRWLTVTSGGSNMNATSCGGRRPIRGSRGARSPPQRTMGRLFGEPQRIGAHASPGRLAVLYDGGCEMCRNVAAGILRYDNTEVLELFDANDPAAR